MLAVPADRLPAALAELDPGNRALLDLSLRRGVSDAEIGELLRKEPADVARGREAVLELLADALGVVGSDRRERVRGAVAALPDDAWHAPRKQREPEPRADEPEPPPAPERPVAADPEPEAEASDDADDGAERPRPREEFYFRPDEPRRGRGGLIAAIGLLIVVVVVAILLLSGGDDDEPAPSSDRTTTEPAPGPDGDGGEPGGDGPADERTVTLRPLAGERGEGRATVARDGSIVLTVRGLPRAEGGYAAWLYDDIVDAISIGTFDGPSGRLQVRLPAQAARYRFLDVSQEPPDGNPNHSGDSVLRAPLRGLLSRGG